MLGKTIIVRCKGYGWCVGKIIKKVTRGLANFIAKFEVDDEPCTLTLESSDYDISPDAEYNAWMIIEPEAETARCVHHHPVARRACGGAQARAARVPLQVRGHHLQRLRVLHSDLLTDRSLRAQSNFESNLRKSL